MKQLQGKLLISTSAMDDANFYKAKVFVAEHNADGALGFVINKKFHRALNELVEFSDSPAFPLFDGGPVDKEHLYFIHRNNKIIPNGQHIIGDIYLGGDFATAVSLINHNKITTSDITIFTGYCGWESNELEAEIATGGWIVKEYNAEILFS